ncbi:sensor histidine kinase [Aquabacterium sp.]|uniref:sensor histidine kinase n=1 Tax=Aquabacterium sp. TaxID=1872578 RepID=UPI0037850FB5
MSATSPRIASLWPRSLIGSASFVGAAVVFWALASTLLYFLVPGIETYPRLLVFHECVGLTMMACVFVLLRSGRFDRFRPALRWLLIGLIAIPVGYFLGHQFAFIALGEPMRMVGHQQISLIPILFTVLVGGIALNYFATRETLAREATARSEAQRLAVEAQLRLLRAQLDPHMLFNSLANVRSLVREDVDRAESMIDQLIVYLRSALAASQTDAVALSREFAQLRAYLDIMALRMGPRLRYRLELPAALERSLVPPMLLQPLVENAIKHGLEPKVGHGSIDVVARALHGGIEIRVSDTGLGLPPDEGDEPGARPAGASYGLQHVRDRLRVIYGPAARLDLERREPTGVCAVVFVPANESRRLA